MLETYFFGRIFAAEIYYYSFRYFFVCQIPARNLAVPIFEPLKNVTR